MLTFLSLSDLFSVSYCRLVKIDFLIWFRPIPHSITRLSRSMLPDKVDRRWLLPVKVRARVLFACYWCIFSRNVQALPIILWVSIWCLHFYLVAVVLWKMAQFHRRLLGYTRFLWHGFITDTITPYYTTTDLCDILDAREGRGQDSLKIEHYFHEVFYN